jgi:hypothetical protein
VTERATTREFIAKWRVELLTFAAAVVIATITRFETDAMPLAGLDRSWEAAIAMVLRSSSNFGGDVAFTYGPLGFVQNPTFFYIGNGVLAIWLNFGERVVLAFMLVWLVRERLGWGFALVLSYAIMTTLWVCAPVIMIVSTVAVTCRPSQRKAAGLALGGGALAAYCLLEKANSGVLAGAVLLLGLVFLDGRWRLLGLAVASWAATLVAIWLLAGQTFTDIPGYLNSALQQASAYSGAMLSSEPTDKWLYVAAFALLAVGFGGIWFTGRREDRDVRLPLAVIWLVTWFLLFKQGFVRQGDDEVHTLFMFSASACFIAVLPWSPAQRWPATAAVMVGVVAYVAASPLAITQVFDPPGRLASAATAVRLTFDKRELTRRQDQAGQKILTGLALPPQYGEALRSAPSTPWPSELSVEWAAGGNFRPLPSLQAYAGFTQGLDKRNADKLSSASGPEFVLMRDELEPDNRLLTFDAPRASREMVCRYRADGTGISGWLLLQRGVDRCTRPARKIGTVTAPWGGKVAVPAPANAHSFVYVKIDGTQVKGLEKLRDIAFRPYERQVILDGVSHRLVPATASDGAIVRAGAQADLPGGFAFAPNANTIAVDRDGNPGGSKSQLRYTFYEQPLSSGKGP